jgi:hypothetical protein
MHCEEAELPVLKSDKTTLGNLSLVTCPTTNDVYSHDEKTQKSLHETTVCFWAQVRKTTQGFVMILFLPVV